MFRVLVIVLAMVGINDLICHAEQVFKMQRVPALENRTIPGIIDKELDTKSLIECTIACYESRNCETMRFNSTTFSCAIITNETQGVSFVESELGEAFKYMDSSALGKHTQDGYQYIWELNFYAKFYFDEKLTYFDCKSVCENEDGRLISFEYEVKERVIHPYLDQIREEEGKVFQWWIGLTDTEAEGNFTWVTGQTLTAYTNWKNHEPNNKDPGDITPANCVFISFSQKYYAYFWSDKDCFAKSRCICEMGNFS